jgi:hypothetical protein
MTLCRTATLAAAVLAIALAGCATRPVDWRTTPPADVASCLNDFAVVDQAVAKAGVGDAQSARVPGFPYLRVSRFLASFRDEAAGAAFDAWVGHLAALDAQARTMELANLGIAPVPLSRLEACRALLIRHDLASAPGREALRKATRVPDGYVDGRRLLGLYPLTAPLVAWGHWRWRQQTITHIQNNAYSPKGRWTVYRPVADPAPLPPAWAVDVLGVLDISPAGADALLAAHAPVLRVDTLSAADRVGAVGWRDGEPAVTGDPVAYTLISHTRFRGQVLVQLVYVFWFPERPKQGSLDLLGGALDGLVWRVTLDGRGQPLVYDAIHPCGCYHLFFPRPGLRRRDKWSIYHEGATTPAAAPALAAGERIVITLAAASHYIRGIGVTADFRGTPYGLRPYDDLRSLQGENGRRSLFAPDGLVKGTERPERHLFWPMGIRSAGAMRQWGHHATAFVGKRHFDDPYLLETTFGAAP